MTEGRDEGRGEPVRGELVPIRDPGSTREWAELLVARAREDGVALTGEGVVLCSASRNLAGRLFSGS
jgi:hypothetical protein